MNSIDDDYSSNISGSRPTLSPHSNTCVPLSLPQVVVVVGTLSFAIYCYFYFDNVHFHITHGYAKLGYAPAQHQVGQRYLHGELCLECC